MQIIKIECQKCESVKTIETDGFFLICKKPSGGSWYCSHDISEVEAMLNATLFLSDSDLKVFKSLLPSALEFRKFRE